MELTTLNQWGREQIPFFFMLDFEGKHGYLAPLDQMTDNILFSIAGVSNSVANHTIKHSGLPPTLIIKQPVSFEIYAKAFNQVLTELKNGNTYLLNLTFPTEIELNQSLLEIFHLSQAPFKLYVKEQLVVFSPERFIRIDNGIIKTYPMKGTIDASQLNARAKILADEKETAEHTTVVDLLRNDLALVAKQVRVEKFRYIDHIKAGKRELLQVSSEISGRLASNWRERIGDLLAALLPAGSISGAPKRKTVEIIKAVETSPRGFFTGVFGYFDGIQRLDSAVMIRFIEQTGNQFIYKSGGGITMDSQLEREYQEMLEKVYLPI